MKLLVKISVVLLMVSGCIKINDTRPINSDIEIRMIEILNETGRTLELYCSTTEEYPCINFLIDRSFSVKSGNISIRFKNVIDPGICATAIGPATTTIDLGSLKPGVYNLTIDVVDKRSSGNLIVTPDQYIIDIGKKKQLVLNGPVLNRVPDNTFWGTVGYHQTSTEPVVNQFISSLLGLGAATGAYLPGDYGYFSIDEWGEIEAPQNHGYYFIRPFIFTYEGASDNLENLLRTYRQNHGNDVSIMLYTSQGEIFRSWMLQ